MQAFGNAKLTGHHGSAAFAAAYAVLGRSAQGVPDDEPPVARVPPEKVDARKTTRRTRLVSATSPDPKQGEIDRRDLLQGNGFQFYRRSGPSKKVLQQQRDKRYRRAMRMLGELHETQGDPDLHDAIATQIVESGDCKRVLMHMADVIYRQKHRPQAELRGSNHHRAKLNEEKVIAIRHLYGGGEYSQNKLAKMFGVSQPTIMNVVQGMGWKAVGGPIHVPSADDIVFRNMIRAALGMAPLQQAGEYKGAHVVDEESPMAQSGFEQFWAIYPKRIAKLAALKAYEKARTVASDAEILAGLKNYIANLPDDARYVAHASSWLSAGRWMDEYDAPVKVAVDCDWYVACAKLHGGECGGDRMRHHIRTQIEKEKVS